MADEDREALARAQAALLAALTGHEELPPGFDPERVRAATEALAHKREHSVVATWPELARALGAEFHPLFDRYAAEEPLPHEGGPMADGWRFARWLETQARFPAAATLESLRVSLRFRPTAEGLIPRRGPVFRLRYLRPQRTLVLAIRWKPGRETWWRLRLPSRSNKP
ncbi:hypothetical protein [Archangium lipolyticum]|uniref:hypothetical protein n=1 Tax=Archangium lipolyticum TaxID=2970465 RepID=UPI002149A678|nr:hypothetical protein [Archangium lipolyticum]